MSKYNEKITRGIYKRIVGAMSGLADIDVEINAQVTPHWDPNHRVIRMPLTISYADNDEEEFALGRGITVHEASHVLFAPDISSKDGNKDFAEWFNVFVDCNNEWKTTQLWPHLKDPLAYKTRKLLEKKPKLLKSDNPFMQVIMRCDKVAELKPEFPENYNPKIQKFVEQVSARFHHKNIAEATGEEVKAFTKEVNEEWQKLCKNSEEECKNSGSKAIHKLMKELGDIIKKGGTPADVKAKQEEISKAKGEAPQWFEDEVNRQLVREATKTVGQNNYNNLSLDELKKMLAEARPQEGSVKIAPGNSWGCAEINVGQMDSFRAEVSTDKTIDLKTAYKQGKLINKSLRKKVHLQEDFEKKHRSGRIDLTEIRKQVAQMGRIYKESTFERENDFKRGGEWAIEVLCDCSGSMSGTKMREAKLALSVLGYALDGLPNVKYALTGFSHANGVPVEYQVKRFKDKRFDIRRMESLTAGDGNADGYNIRASSKRLLKYQNLKKVLVVISDGQPAYCNGIEDTKKAVAIAERYGIKVIGIGIKGCTEESLNEIYPNSYYFNNTKDLHKELTSLILSALGQRDKTILVKRKWER